MIQREKKIGSKTYDCMFIGYAENSVAYRFLVFKSDVWDHNTIIETKNVEFFEHIYPLKEKISHTPIFNNALINNNRIDETHIEEIRSKRQRKETSFRNEFLTYLVDNDPITYIEVVSSSDSLFWKETIKVEIDSLLQNQTWEIVDLPPGAKLLVANGSLKENIFLMVL